MDAAGGIYLASYLASTAPVDLDGRALKSASDADLLVAKLDPDGRVRWASTYGDAGADSRVGFGTAVTKDDVVAVVGSFSGGMTLGNIALKSATSADFLTAFRASDGKPVWAKRFDQGANGWLRSVAANPRSQANRIAVCGRAVQAAKELVPGAQYAGGHDIVIAMFNSAGAKLWSLQVGGAGNEECNALAIDDKGDLYAAGKFDSAALTFGKLPPLEGPKSFSRYIWLAKFDGATGKPRMAVASSGAGHASPRSIAIDGAGKVILAGQFTSSVTFGNVKLSGFGADDAFVAKLDPSAGLAPTWAVALGGPEFDAASGVAVTSSGDVWATGSFNLTTQGAAALTAKGSSSPDVFLLGLDGRTGATLFAQSFGDAATQAGDAIAVNRFGADQVALAGTLNGSIELPAPVGAIHSARGTEAFLLVGAANQKKGSR